PADGGGDRDLRRRRAARVVRGPAPDAVRRRAREPPGRVRPPMTPRTRGERAVPADLVFVNGTVHPMDGGRPAQAVAVRAGRITAVGSSAEVEALAGPGTEVVDLAGGTLLP